jgi:hypothetical protein
MTTRLVFAAAFVLSSSLFACAEPELEPTTRSETSELTAGADVVTSTSIVSRKSCVIKYSCNSKGELMMRWDNGHCVIGQVVIGSPQTVATTDDHFRPIMGSWIADSRKLTIWLDGEIVPAQCSRIGE